MGGMSIFGWIAIGVIASWTLTRLMVTPGDDLTPFVAALAGSLWLTSITCVVTSGRERRRQPRLREG